MKTMNKTALAVLTALALLCAAFILTPDAERSALERRRLTAAGDLQWGEPQTLEAYFADQLPQRQRLRNLKTWVETAALRRGDVGGYYREGEHLFESQYPTDARQIAYAASHLAEVCETYLPGKNLCWAVVPDKGYFAEGSRPGLDYQLLLDTMASALPAGAAYADLFSALTLADYYRTDPHWRQERLTGAAAELLRALDAKAPARTYTENTLSPFTGLYPGKSGLWAEPETLTYLTDAVTESACVTSAETGDMAVYTVERWETDEDGYNVFLGGPQAVVTIDNPLAETERELVVFRDSFGSAMAPLLLGGYSRVTLVDLRYVAPQLLPQLVDLEAADDVLLLFSAQVLNAGRILK